MIKDVNESNENEIEEDDKKFYEISKCGKCLIEWEPLREQLARKYIKVVTTQFNGEIDEEIHKRIKGFKHPPFTLQRICEMLVEPKRFYNNSKSFHLAFKKLINIDNF